MADDMTVLRLKNPAIAEFLDQWKSKYEKRRFDLTKESDQADFYEAMLEMARHIAHVADSATLDTIVSIEGVNMLYVNAT